MVLLSAQGMPVVKIAEVTCTSAGRVRDVIYNFNADGFDFLYLKYKGERPKTFTLPERREVKKISKSKPAEHGLPILLRREASPFQRVKTWKTSLDPDHATKKPGASTPGPRLLSL